MELSNKMLLLMSILPYPVSMAAVMFCVYSKEYSNAFFRAFSQYLVEFLSVLFFILGTAGLFISAFGNEKIQPQHWASFQLSSLFLTSIGSKLKNRQLG
jgi:hypothetical protein